MTEGDILNSFPHDLLVLVVSVILVLYDVSMIAGQHSPSDPAVVVWVLGRSSSDDEVVVCEH